MKEQVNSAQPEFLTHPNKLRVVREIYRGCKNIIGASYFLLKRGQFIALVGPFAAKDGNDLSKETKKANTADSIELGKEEGKHEEGKPGW